MRRKTVVLVLMMYVAVALLLPVLPANKMAAAEATSQSLSDGRDLTTARVGILPFFGRVKVLFDRIRIRSAMAASICVTIRVVTTAEVRPVRAPRATEG